MCLTTTEKWLLALWLVVSTLLYAIYVLVGFGWIWLEEENQRPNGFSTAEKNVIWAPSPYQGDSEKTLQLKHV